MTVDSAVDLVGNSKTDYKWQSSLQFQIESSGLVDETKDKHQSAASGETRTSCPALGSFLPRNQHDIAKILFLAM